MKRLYLIECFLVFSFHFFFALVFFCFIRSSKKNKIFFFSLKVLQMMGGMVSVRFFSNPHFVLHHRILFYLFVCLFVFFFLMPTIYSSYCGFFSLWFFDADSCRWSKEENRFESIKKNLRSMKQMLLYWMILNWIEWVWICCNGIRNTPNRSWWLYYAVILGKWSNQKHKSTSRSFFSIQKKIAHNNKSDRQTN